MHALFRIPGAGFWAEFQNTLGSDRNLCGDRLMPAQKLGARAGQSQIPVAGQMIEPDKMALDRWIAGHLENRGAFVDFIEHRDENRICPAQGR